MTIDSNVLISNFLGFAASSWRSGDPPKFSDQNLTVKYVGTPYPTSSDPSPAVANIDLTPVYGDIFWQQFFETLFPSVKNQDFLNEKSTGTPGGYYIQLYKAAAADFYDSFFRGRDDLGSNSQGQTFSLASWSSLSTDQQKLIIKQYLFTRSTNVDTSNFKRDVYDPVTGQTVETVYNKDFTEKMLLNNLNLRSINVFYYVAMLMTGVMGELQNNTINAGRYATRLAETQKAISTEMQDKKYLYKTLLNAQDYATIKQNENNGQILENLRMRRDLVQKQTDQASSFLESSQQAVEEQASQGTEFMKKGQELSQLFYKNF